MKARFVLLTLISFAAAVSCSKTSQEATEEGTITIKPTRAEFLNASSSKTVTVTSSSTWKAACDQDWVSLSATTGKSGDKVEIKVSENIAAPGKCASSRTGEVIFSVGDVTATFKITQRGEETSIVASSTMDPIVLTYEGGTFPVQVLYNTEYTVTSSADWLTYVKDSGTKSSTTDEYTCTVAAYTSSEDRTATLTFKAGEEVSVLEVTQTGKTQVKLPGKEVALSAEFQVNRWGKKVKFSPGYLYWSGKDKAYLFEENQLGGWCQAERNIPWDPDHVNHLYWSSDPDLAHAENSVNETSPSTAVFFANTLSADWHTLSAAEWDYIIDHYKWNANVTIADKYQGLIITPKGLVDDIKKTYTESEWKALEKQGYIFLPSGGCREGALINNPGNYSCSWTHDYYKSIDSDPEYQGKIVDMFFHTSFSCNNVHIDYPTGFNTNSGYSPYEGHYVRLATVTVDVEAPSVNGEFTVSAEGKKVNFAKGNLFFDGKYFNIEDSQTAFCSKWDSTHVSHFYWTDNFAYCRNRVFIDDMKANPTPYWEKEETYSTALFFANYYPVFGSPWKNLTKDEWVYLFANHKNKACADVCGVKCTLVACDGFSGTLADSYDSSSWPSAEASGILALPLAGTRTNGTVSQAGTVGSYWSSVFAGHLQGPETPGSYTVTASQSQVSADAKTSIGTASCIRLARPVK